ncbi:MAG: pantetheine-phosphate adenylyltransferase [Candidatus Lokiarchaeota archaeon]|nr:pantetheine-phosphate adenylyltransferase [Candidatus Lokiarchaeota archaeon]
MITIFNVLGLGGTFDHLHEGHKLLIRTALEFSRKIVIGLISDSLLNNKKFASKLEKYEIRKKKIVEFIAGISDPNRVEIIELKDPFGPPIYEEKYEAIVVSQETYSNALKINELRLKKGFKPLIIIVIPILKDKFEHKISSTSIRKNMI